MSDIDDIKAHIDTAHALPSTEASLRAELRKAALVDAFERMTDVQRPSPMSDRQIFERGYQDGFDYAEKRIVPKEEASTVLEPLGDQVLAKQVDAESVSDGGIILPSGGEPPKEAIILAIGPGKRLETGEIVPMQVAVGDHIVFAHYGGQDLEVDGEKLMLLRQDDILAKVKKERS